MKEFINKEVTLGVLQSLKSGGILNEEEEKLNKQIDEAISAVIGVPGMTAEEKYEVFTEVHNEQVLEDAKRQVKDYFDGRYFVRQDRHYDENNLPIDYAYLAMQFEKKFDCNIAENSVWQSVITDYVRDLIAKAEETFAREHPERAPMKVSVTPVDIDAVYGAKISEPVVYDSKEQSAEVSAETDRLNTESGNRSVAEAVRVNAEATLVDKLGEVIAWVMENYNKFFDAYDNEVAGRNDDFQTGYLRGQRDAFTRGGSMLKIVASRGNINGKFFELYGNNVSLKEFFDSREKYFEHSRFGIKENEHARGYDEGAFAAYTSMIKKYDETFPKREEPEQNIEPGRGVN